MEPPMSERFYLNGNWKEGDTARLEGTEHHHMIHVVKIRVGEEVELLNGRGLRGVCVLKTSDKRSALLEVQAVKQEPLPPPRFILALPLMRPSKLEWVIEKGTEIGADAFWLYPADHSEKEALSEHQLERLGHIAISAMKQCGRADLPPIRLLPGLKELLQEAPLPRLFGDVELSGKKLSELRPQTALFITGPERGFSQDETALLKLKGQGVHLPTHTLRAETAPIVALSMLIALL